MTDETHDEIMQQDGYVLVGKSRRSFFGGPKRPRSVIEKQVGDPRVSLESVQASVEHAHKCLDQFLSEYMLKLLSSLSHAVGSARRVRTLRAIGIGNFFDSGSDSALQLAAFQRIQRHFEYPPAFYQEPRCVNAEELFLQSVGITLLPADSLHSLPKPVQQLTRPDPSDVHLVFMIHFDLFGFERLTDSFACLDRLDSLVFVGNAVPTDRTSKLMASRLEHLDSVSVQLPDRRNSPRRNLQDRCTFWWQKSFANTRIYFARKL